MQRIFNLENLRNSDKINIIFVHKFQISFFFLKNHLHSYSTIRISIMESLSNGYKKDISVVINFKDRSSIEVEKDMIRGRKRHRRAYRFNKWPRGVQLKALNETWRGNPLGVILNACKTDKWSGRKFHPVDKGDYSNTEMRHVLSAKFNYFPRFRRAKLRYHGSHPPR